MASSSSTRSMQVPQWKYDVFLSFRGEDTRRNFTSHLYEVLRYRGICTFLDEKRLEHGDSIPGELVKAIKDSQVAVIIFSRNYATSRWCLNELVTIMECKDKNGQKKVIPVFYNVNPSHVRNQRRSFAKAFHKHKLNYEGNTERMQRMEKWRTALKKAANLKGCDTRDKIESECIREVVDQISSKLCKTSLSYLKNVVGIDTHLKEVNSLLEMENDDVRIVWIWGMGGVGKTTIARAIFYTLKSQFDGACFLEIKENKDTIHSLQNILLSELLGNKENYVNNKDDGKDWIACKLRSMKVLVVLDNIDHRDHLDYLAGNLGWFGKGSRIIATTRDKHLIGKYDGVHEVTTLLEHDAIKLFNQHAFREEASDPDECFEGLTLEVVSYAKGLPLALQVLGDFLYNKGLTEWRSFVDQIQINPRSEILENLKISYDRLEPDEKEIFLDIACFLRGRKKTEIVPILDSCGFGAGSGLRVLTDRSLVSISEYDMIQMHDLIEEMGKYIVKMQKDRGELSRLWLAEDFERSSNAEIQGIEAIEAIWLHEIQDLSFRENAMKKMQKLRILYIKSFHAHDDSIEYLPNNLRWFDCCDYPWESLPAIFKPSKLVHLDLRRSSLRHLLTERKMHIPRLRKLQKLDLSGSKNLMRTPDFSDMPNLQYLGLERCSNLKQVDYSLRDSRKLVELNLRDCTSLEMFPDLSGESLKYLYLQDCSSLENFPKIWGGMKTELEIHMQRSGIRKLPLDIFQHQASLTELDLSAMKNLATLPTSIFKLKSLVRLNVSDCSKLESFPEEIGDLENLEWLDARDTLISQPPSSIVRLNKLKFLSFEKQKSEAGPQDGVYFVFPPVADGLQSLEQLDLSYCNLRGLPEDIGSLSSLKQFILRGNNFEHLPQSIAQLGALRYLDLSYCKRLKELPEFREMRKFGFRFLHKDEPELEAMLQTTENNDEPTEHHDSVINEASCSSQIVTFLRFVGTLSLRICSNE